MSAAEFSRRASVHAPKIGRQSVEILRESGYSEEAIRTLLATRATIDGSLEKR